MDQLAPGPVRESAISSYAEAVGQWNPEAGARLALKTADPAAREQRVKECFLQWLAWDSDSAKRWLKETSLPEGVKSRWLSEKPRPEF